MKKTTKKAIDPNAEIKKTLLDSLCFNHSGKMAGLISCSTSVIENANCQNRRAAARRAVEINPDLDFICLHCFADAQLHYQTTTGKKYARNTELYTSQVYAPELWPLLNASIARIEAFGDTQPGKKGEIQVENYFNFCKNNPDTTFAMEILAVLLFAGIYSLILKVISD